MTGVQTCALPICWPLPPGASIIAIVPGWEVWWSGMTAQTALREHRRQIPWLLCRLSKRLLQFYLRLSWLPKRQSLRHPHSWAYGIIRGPELRRGFCLFFDWKRSIIFNEKNSIVHNQLQYQITCQDDPKSLGMLLFSKKFRANSRANQCQFFR